MPLPMRDSPPALVVNALADARFVRACCQVGLAGTCGPCAEACGLYFAKIKVRYQRLPDGEEDRDIMVV